MPTAMTIGLYVLVLVVAWRLLKPVPGQEVVETEYAPTEDEFMPEEAPAEAQPDKRDAA